MTVVEDAAVARRSAARDGHKVAIRIEALSKRFAVRRRWAEIVFHQRAARYARVVSDVSFEVDAGEFFGILGPNGAGKTTLFRMLATLLIPDSGHATILGHDTEHEAAMVRRLVGSVMANERTLHWRLSAHENLRLFAALHGVPQADATRRIGEVLEIVELRDTGGTMVATFSSGMKQRLLIARALLPRPRVLLLDEPTRSLDPIAARDFRVFLKDRLVRREGCTILLATHNGEEAMSLCDRVAILDKGRVLAVGTPGAIGHAVGDQRYLLWTRSPSHPVFAALDADGLIADLSVADADVEWTCVRFVIPGDIAAAARILDLLQCAGVEVARFERAPLTLADLIERVVAASRGRSP